MKYILNKSLIMESAEKIKPFSEKVKEEPKKEIVKPFSIKVKEGNK